MLDWRIVCGALIIALGWSVQAGADDDLARRLVKLEGATNFRDLGGYPTQDGRSVKWDLVFRSDSLHYLSETDWEKVDDLEIKVVNDLRGSAERERWPSHWPATADVTVLSRDYSIVSDGIRTQGYHSLAYDQIESFRRMFDRLAEPDAPPTLIHCTGGRDRTGFAAAFLLTVLGVDRDTILDDYSLSHQLRGEAPVNRERLREMIAFYELDADQESMIAQQTHPERREAERIRMAKALDAIAAEHGSVLAFILEELQVDDFEIAHLRSRLLVDRGGE